VRNLRRQVSPYYYSYLQKHTAELGKFNLLRGSRLSVARSFSSTVVFIDPDFSVDDFAA